MGTFDDEIGGIDRVVGVIDHQIVGTAVSCDAVLRSLDTSEMSVDTSGDSVDTSRGVGRYLGRLDFCYRR